ncbi:MAG: hypothetical protein K2X82_15630 [Gemmataceae bacterium]|nr:hypothetical protein [Gemmataceae bacterium]
MTRLLSRLFAAPSARTAPARRPARLSAELLEGRDVPAGLDAGALALKGGAAPPAVTAALDAGVLTITGTDRADQVRVSAAGGRVVVLAAGEKADPVTHGKDFTPVNATTQAAKIKAEMSDPPGWTFDRAAVTRIVFRGNAGNDYFRNDTGIACEARGWQGNDTLIGGGGADTLIGGLGDDVAYGRGGVDDITAEVAYQDALPPADDGKNDEKAPPQDADRTGTGRGRAERQKQQSDEVVP